MGASLRAFVHLDRDPSGPKFVETILRLRASLNAHLSTAAIAGELAYLAGPGAAPQPSVEGLTPEQRVFVGWAQQWCEVATPQAERLKAATNPHSANPYRVNGVVSNMPEFQKAFSCKAGAPMVGQNICRVW